MSGLTGPSTVSARSDQPEVTHREDSQYPSGAAGRGDHLLTVQSLSKTFNATRALSDIRLAVDSGEIHVLMGHNGSGKSTLIKVLSGYHVPDPGGSVWIGGQPLKFGAPEVSHRLGCRFVHQDLALIAQGSVLDNIALGYGFPTRFGTIRTKGARKLTIQALEAVGLDVDPATPVSRLSAVQKTQLAVARALRTDGPHPARVLVLDEPTASLPVDDVDHLLATVNAVAGQGLGVLYVTHHLEEMFKMGTRVTVLRDGSSVATYTRAELTRSRLVRDLVGDDIGQLRRSPSAVESGPAKLLEVDGLSAGTLSDIRFTVRPGEILGFAGLAGSGRESILGAVFGSIERRAGAVRLQGRELPAGRPDRAVAAGLAYMPADRKVHGGVMTLSARENITLASTRSFATALRLRGRAEKAEVTSWFDRLEIRPSRGTELPLASFSGGNQQKILFAKWLRLGHPVFMLDDPTQGVDIGAKAALHRQLIGCADGGAGVVITSSDLDELSDLCDRVLVLHHGQIVSELPGEEVTPAVLTVAISSREGFLEQ